MALWVWRFVEGEPPHFFRAPAFDNPRAWPKTKTTRLRRKTNPVGTWYFTSAHNSDTILNVSHLVRTRSIASLPRKAILGDWHNLFSRNHYIIRGFSPWNGERFLSLGQSGMPSWEGGGVIVWLAAWKLVSNDAKRTIPPPNAKHSTLLQGCFLCFHFWFYPRFGNSIIIAPLIFHWTVNIS